MDWSPYFPAYISAAPRDAELASPSKKVKLDKNPAVKKVEFADIGCGYGGLLVALAPLFPDTLMLGMEIRAQVTQYVHERLLALRQENTGKYQNVSVMRANAMKFLPNYFEKHQVSKDALPVTRL